MQLVHLWILEVVTKLVLRISQETLNTKLLPLISSPELQYGGCTGHGVLVTTTMVIIFFSLSLVFFLERGFSMFHVPLNITQHLFPLYSEKILQQHNSIFRCTKPEVKHWCWHINLFQRCLRDEQRYTS